MNAPPRPRPTLNSQPSTLNSPRGFTLVELLVVIVIIAVLIGLITPAIFAAITNARVAEVRAEISQLESAIASFKAEYGGIEPPSRITLHVDQAGWNGDPRSKAIIRRIWPQFDFTGTGGGGWTSARTLNGAECLVFFLGGVRDNSGALVGFSKNPALPFATTGGRNGPFFEFDGGFDTATAQWKGRLMDADSNDVPEYRDPWPGQSSPYIYLSSYDGRGYQADDVTELQTITTTSFVSWYTQSSGGPEHKPNSHQIISPGPDGEYGTGGVYDDETADTDLLGAREGERDNITNFTGGRLVP